MKTKNLKAYNHGSFSHTVFIWVPLGMPPKEGLVNWYTFLYYIFLYISQAQIYSGNNSSMAWIFFKYLKVGRIFWYWAFKALTNYSLHFKFKLWTPLSVYFQNLKASLQLYGYSFLVLVLKLLLYSTKRLCQVIILYV